MEIKLTDSPDLDAFHSTNREAWDEAKRGELISEAELKIQMADFKKAWKESRLGKNQVSEYRLTPTARKDLQEIWAYIAEDDVRSADQLEADLLKACRLLASQPGLGTARPLWTSLAVKFWVVKRNYFIMFAKKRTFGDPAVHSPSSGYPGAVTWDE